jgi:ankyrin repeat protein
MFSQTLSSLQQYNCDYSRWPVQKTLLMHASQRGRVDIVQYMLELGADPNTIASGRARSTAIHKAAFYRHQDVVTALLAAGADVSIVNAAGETYLEAWAAASPPTTSRTSAAAAAAAAALFSISTAPAARIG